MSCSVDKKKNRRFGYPCKNEEGISLRDNYLVDKRRASDWFHAWRAAEMSISLSHKWANWPRMCANDLTEVIQLVNSTVDIDARSPNYKSIVMRCGYLKAKILKMIIFKML